MKKLVLLLGFQFVFINIIIAQNWQWAKQMGGNGNAGGGPCIDISNNLYYYGNFEGNCYLQNDTLYSNGFNDLFLVKLDANGNEVWSKKFGGANPFGTDERSGWRAIDNSGNFLYVSGSFYGTMIVGSDTVISSGDLDVFLAKFDLNGNCVWLRKAGSSAQDIGGVFQFDANGNILLTGRSKGVSQFDTITLQTGGFLAKYDTSGDCLWAAKKFNDVYFNCIKYLGNDLIMCGNTLNDTCIIDTSTVIGLGTFNGIVARFDSIGNVKWVNRLGNSNPCYTMFLNIDNQNDIYISGYFRISAIINSDTLTNGNTFDFFLLKFNQNGNTIWVTQSHASGNAGAEARILNTDGDGNTYLVGYFSGNGSFDTFNITANNANQDMFLARYNSSGVCLGIRHFGEADATGVLVDNSGSVIVSGLFYNSVSIGSTSLTSVGNSDIFLAKIDAITGTGGENRTSQNQLVIYANPNKGTFNIKVPDEIKTFKKAVLIIYDNTGKETTRFALDNESDYPHFDVTNASKGIYTVRLVQGEKSYTGKLVVE